MLLLTVLIFIACCYFFIKRNNKFESKDFNKAIVLDVRNKEDYEKAHIKSSLNVPLVKLKTKDFSFFKKQPIVVCCSNGIESLIAFQILKGNGYKSVFNGGVWYDLEKYLNYNGGRHE